MIKVNKKSYIKRRQDASTQMYKRINYCTKLPIYLNMKNLRIIYTNVIVLIAYSKLQTYNKLYKLRQIKIYTKQNKLDMDYQPKQTDKHNQNTSSHTFVFRWSENTFIPLNT